MDLQQFCTLQKEEDRLKDLFTKKRKGKIRSRFASKSRLTCWYCKNEGQEEVGIVTEKLVFSEALSVNDQNVRDV